MYSIFIQSISPQIFPRDKQQEPGSEQRQRRKEMQGGGMDGDCLTEQELWGIRLSDRMEGRREKLVLGKQRERGGDCNTWQDSPCWTFAFSSHHDTPLCFWNQKCSQGSTDWPERGKQRAFPCYGNDTPCISAVSHFGM